ncbi:MAG: FAD-dependent oxidoreductase [Deltaproteobacteria bacterium]|nr:FAD-dependent oxidoreductase [Deltaproteobacteria bacterium]
MTSPAEVAASDVRDAHAVRRWDREADVVVVGLGCAGASAAIEAAEAGAETLVLERAGGGGGTSALAGGLIYLGGGTPVQEACGYHDTPDAMARFLTAACGPETDAAKIRAYCEESVAHFHWFEAHGVPFKRSFYPEPSMEPPTDDCLVFSGGEDAHPFDRLTPPVPRAHKPRHPNAAGGFLMQRLVAAAERSGAAVLADARVDTLVVERDGRVAGVVVRHDGREQAVRARRAVVLAAGGFIQNDDMLRRHSPLLRKCSIRLGVEGDDGRAIRMAMGAGADVARMHAGEVAVPITPPRRLIRGILVTPAGQRFINEDAYYGRVGQEGLFRHGGRMFLIVDTAIYERNLAGFEPSFVEETIADLERAAGFPDGSLQRTVELYNRHAATGVDPLFHKHARFLQPLRDAPFAAIDCGTDKVVWATFTLGGLRTDVESAVLRPDGQVIPGLFAAGRTTSGIAAEGYVSGISIGDGTFFGRRAGRNAARGAS